MKIKIRNIAVANPPLKLSQADSLKAVLLNKNLSRRGRALYKCFLLDKGIKTRTFAVKSTCEFFEEKQDALIRRFQKEAVSLSAASLKRCLKRSGLDPSALSGLVTATCTGYLCPGLSSYVMEHAGLKKDVFAIDLVGMGCGGALPAIQSAFNYLQAHPKSYAAVVATEICSSALYWGEDPELILSNSIFGDGSAACLLTNKENIPGLKIVDLVSEISPKHRETLRFRTENSKLRNVIKPEVPQIASSLLDRLIRCLCSRNRLERSEIDFWAIHPGGRKVLDEIQKTLGLKAEDLKYSRKVLQSYGNMSSPTVLYVLREILKDKDLKKGSRVIAASFGAGFSCYAALLSYE